MNNKKHLVVSGNIVDELSEKIPNYLVAINELIKNSFDADAKNVLIKISTENKTLEIIDDGYGMDETSINNLLHISKSYKNFAHLKNNGRYIQGSKGLGFLAAFKFGDKVTWNTRFKENKYTNEFSIFFNDLIQKDNISDYSIPVLKTKSLKTQGTSILINLSDDAINLFIADLLDNEGNQSRTLKRLLNSFNFEDFKISIKIDDISFTKNEQIIYHNILPDRILFNVKFKSSQNTIEYYHNNVLAFSENFDVTIDNTEIDLDLVYYHLYPYAKRKIDDLFYDHNDEIVPLIYINQNLFENYDLFNPMHLGYQRSGNSLRQFIGIININSENKSLDFNSDRTQFLDNKYTRNLTSYLKDLNRKIQQTISAKKEFLVPKKENEKNNILIQSNTQFDKTFNFNKNCLKKYIQDKFAFKDDVIISHNKREKIIIYTIFNKEYLLKYNIKDDEKNIPKRKKHEPTAKNKPKIRESTSTIKLNKHKDIFYIPNKQINLYDYIDKITDSQGNDVDIENIIIFLNDEEYSKHIIESIENEKKLEVKYKYVDKNTGPVIAKLDLEFKKEKVNIIGGTKKETIIKYPGSIDYKINYNNTISKLVEQINSLNFKDYKELIVGASRTLFEISVKSIENSNKKFFYKENKSINGLANQVRHVIEYIMNDHIIKNQISQSINFHKDTLNNKLSGLPDKYEEIINKAHLGAHQSTEHLSNSEITDLMEMVGYFLIFTNELIKNFNK